MRVKLTTAVACALCVLGLIVSDTRWKTNVSRDLNEIKINQEQLGWHRDDMARWVRDTERMNQVAGWRGADVDR